MNPYHQVPFGRGYLVAPEGMTYRAAFNFLSDAAYWWDVGWGLPDSTTGQEEGIMNVNLSAFLERRNGCRPTAEEVRAEARVYRVFNRPDAWTPSSLARVCELCQDTGGLYFQAIEDRDDGSEVVWEIWLAPGQPVALEATYWGPPIPSYGATMHRAALPPLPGVVVGFSAGAPYPGVRTLARVGKDDGRGHVVCNGTAVVYYSEEGDRE